MTQNYPLTNTIPKFIFCLHPQYVNLQIYTGNSIPEIVTFDLPLSGT